MPAMSPARRHVIFRRLVAIVLLHDSIRASCAPWASTASDVRSEFR